MLACRRRSSMNVWGNSISNLRSGDRVIDFRMVGDLRRQCSNTQSSDRCTPHRRSSNRRSPDSIFELHYRNPPAPLFRWGGFKARDQRVLLQEPGKRSLELTGAVAVNQPDHVLVAEQRFVEKS